jgi:hypothetical protein
MKKAKPSSKPVAASKPAAAKPTKAAAAKNPAATKPPLKQPAAKAPVAKPTPRNVSAKVSGPTAAEALAIPPNGTLAERVAAGKKIEAFDRPVAARSQSAASIAAAASSSFPQRITGFPDTFISQISVRLEDPDHPVTLTWTGPVAGAQETGPFRSSPGAGLRSLNCDDEATSRRSGSTCTPKGTFAVTGFAAHLNSHLEATEVTWFVPARGIALHFYPTVPKFAASHGCVRLEKLRVAQLIKNNSRAGQTQVVVAGTWTKPAHQH